jgi:phenylacetyl-CoA:acceptor oxidoreductase subunit 1
MIEEKHTPRWGMVIDVSRCTGCSCCTVNCAQTHSLPEGVEWRRVTGVDLSTPDQPRHAFLSMSCMQCANPPCLDVCPSGATGQRADGIVTVDAQLCMGCSYCVVACPYLARTLVPDMPRGFHGSRESVMVSKDLQGTCTKCDFCIDRVDTGIAKGLKPGIDPEASPVCVTSCLSSAIHFGDLNDPDGNLRQLLRQRTAARMQEELGTDPSVYYLID